MTNSAYLFDPMKKAPIIQYAKTSDKVGRVSVTIKNQPKRSRIGLLTDSVITSRYGRSFVLIGGIL